MARRAYLDRKIETASPRALASLQGEKLRRQIDYLQRRSPFYRKKFARNGISPGLVKGIDDLRRFPFTTKDELRESQIVHPPLGDYVACKMDRIIRIHSSTGTTGRPSLVGITRHDKEVWASISARAFYTQGVGAGDIVLHAMGLSLFVGGLPVKDAMEKIGCTFVPVGTGASDRLVMVLQILGAAVLHCTPSYAIYLAEYIREKFNLEPNRLGVRKIVTGAEPGGGVPSVRSKIQTDWGGLVTEGMGNADVAPVIFGECEAQEGMHFCAQEYIIPEIIDPDKDEVLPIEAGVSGELVYSVIDRECMPLIRFRSRDRVSVLGNNCPCGRTSFRIRCVGRTDDMLIVLGVNVFPSAVKDVVGELTPKTTGEVEIIVPGPGPKVDPPLRLKVEYGRRTRDLSGLKREIERRIRSRLSVPAQVTLVPPGTLPRYEMKAQLVRKEPRTREGPIDVAMGLPRRPGKGGGDGGRLPEV